MHPPRRDPRTYISEQYAAKAARAARQGHHLRAAQLYFAALRAMEGDDEYTPEPSEFVVGLTAEEAASGVRMRGENDTNDIGATGKTDIDESSKQTG